MQVSQTDLIMVMMSAADRLMPGMVINPVAMNALIAAANALVAANAAPTPAERLQAAGFPDRGLRDHLPPSVSLLSDEDQHVALDRIPGWEAA